MADTEGNVEQKFKVGVMGCGFVGSAVISGFALNADIKAYDVNPKRTLNTLEEVCKQDIIFLCVPTPMRKSDGKPELSFMAQALRDIFNVVNLIGYDKRKIIAIKSTVLPGTNRKFQEEYPMFDFVSNPEFLTARSARLDFINASRIIIGTPKREVCETVIDLYRNRFDSTPIFCCTWEEAEFVKYMANCFFAMKVSFLNEIYLLCKKLGLGFWDVKQMWLADGRIGNSHHEVPGHDGDLGFGGTCFPKDIAAFTTWAREQDSPMRTLEAAKAVNNNIRQKKDWEVYDDTK